ncbi:hypothetical protein SAMN05720471_1151 [Fibrobacter sp. UWP2]|nr:hypothetical protein SAMN05720471_1151 [Fibrobacter sp. UWP2]
MMHGFFFEPKELRPVDNEKSPKLNEIENRPGYYKWWANKKDFRMILSKLGADFDTIIRENVVECFDEFYCVYVGIAVKESVRSRINWHVNDKHDKKRVEKGYLSTLRQTISSIVANNQLAKKETNDFIDRLKVEVFYSNYEINSIEAKTEIEKIEKDLIQAKLRVLNIRDNEHPSAQSMKKTLQKLRKESKAKALE